MHSWLSSLTENTQRVWPFLSFPVYRTCLRNKGSCCPHRGVLWLQWMWLLHLCPTYFDQMRDSVSLGFVLLRAAMQCSQNTLGLSPKIRSFVLCSSELGYHPLLALICSLKNSGVTTLAHWMEKIRVLCILNLQHSRVQPALSRTETRTARPQGNWVWPALDGQMLLALFNHCDCCRRGTKQQLCMSPGPPAALLAPAGSASLWGAFLFSLQGHRSSLPCLCQVLFLIPAHTAPLQGGTAILEVMGYLLEGPSFRLLFSISSFPVQIENVLL